MYDDILSFDVVCTGSPLQKVNKQVHIQGEIQVNYRNVKFDYGS